MPGNWSRSVTKRNNCKTVLALEFTLLLAINRLVHVYVPRPSSLPLIYNYLQRVSLRAISAQLQVRTSEAFACMSSSTSISTTRSHSTDCCEIARMSSSFQRELCHDNVQTLALSSATTALGYAVTTTTNTNSNSSATGSGGAGALRQPPLSLRFPPIAAGSPSPPQPPPPPPENPKLSPRAPPARTIAGGNSAPAHALAYWEMEAKLTPRRIARGTALSLTMPLPQDDSNGLSSPAALPAPPA